MGTKRTIDSGRVDKRGHKIKVSGNSLAAGGNVDSKKNQLQKTKRTNPNKNHVEYPNKLGLTDEQVRKTVYSHDYDAKTTFIKYDIALDDFAVDENPQIRKLVAEKGHEEHMEFLIDDKYTVVREAVARNGYGLDKLKDDPDWEVRFAVVGQGHALDELIDDEEYQVREFAKFKKEELGKWG